MTHEEIANLGNLVNLHISEVESTDIIPKLESVLGYIDQIKNVDLDTGVSRDFFATNDLRSDIPVNSDFKEKFMELVPNKEDGYVKVTKVLGNE